MPLLHWFRRRVSLLQEIKLQKQEIESLKRQLTAATDFIDKISWEARACGAKAKAITESMRKREE
jgi:hypothetical protein